MIDAELLTQSYFHRIGLPNKALLSDPTYDAQMKWLRDMVTRLAVILEDEDIPDVTATRIVRSMLYGAPTEEAADLRMRQHETMKRFMESRPGEPIMKLGSA
jgi:hypothetical protein